MRSLTRCALSVAGYATAACSRLRNAGMLTTDIATLWSREHVSVVGRDSREGARLLDG